MKIIVTGGAGFIGAALCRRLIQTTDADLTVIDKLTYAASIDALPSSDRVKLEVCDIGNRDDMDRIFKEVCPDLVFNLAAESHVDRGISAPDAFIQTNIVGTYSLLEAARAHVSSKAPASFRFIHISTDEVFGTLGPTGFFNDASPYDPSSPYSASKAASDHLVRAWGRTYELPILITNCSNNFGPYQFPEKLIPLMILNAMDGKPLPVYGDGKQIRDWLHVDDHVDALLTVAEQGRIGETYTIGSRNEWTNIAIVKEICLILDHLRPANKPHDRLIEYVTDRPGHDRRYAIDPIKIERELGWSARHDFKSGLEATVQWYLDNEDWWKPIREKVYTGDRLGLVN